MSADLGADTWTTFRRVTLPQLRTALLARALPSFALSFDEVIVILLSMVPVYVAARLSREGTAASRL